MKCLKGKAERVNRLRIAKSEGEVRISVKSKTCVRFESILGVTRGGAQQTAWDSNDGQ
jgi:hypothetical protein